MLKWSGPGKWVLPLQVWSELPFSRPWNASCNGCDIIWCYNIVTSRKKSREIGSLIKTVEIKVVRLNVFLLTHKFKGVWRFALHRNNTRATVTLIKDKYDTNQLHQEVKKCQKVLIIKWDCIILAQPTLHEFCPAMALRKNRESVNVTLRLKSRVTNSYAAQTR